MNGGLLRAGWQRSYRNKGRPYVSGTTSISGAENVQDRLYYWMVLSPVYVMRWAYWTVRSIHGQKRNNMKQYNIRYNIGKAKYVVNFHDGVKRHKDGSMFFDIAIFSNKKKMTKFVTNLKWDGYDCMGNV